ncbi:hypothetical protein LBMAG53_10420 [Planctomycetota bacterium]|nr:hypothetical protein LBMAG53_10420 [Planctomycetota bacterium]
MAASDRIAQVEERLRTLAEAGTDVSALSGQLVFAKTAAVQGQVSLVEAICDDVMTAAARLGGSTRRSSSGGFARDSGRFKIPGRQPVVAAPTTEKPALPRPPTAAPTPAISVVPDTGSWAKPGDRPAAASPPPAALEIAPPPMRPAASHTATTSTAKAVAPFQGDLTAAMRAALAGPELAQWAADQGLVTRLQLETNLAEHGQRLRTELAGSIAGDAAQQLAARFRVVASAEQERLLNGIADRLRSELGERIDTALAQQRQVPAATDLAPVLASVEEHLRHREAGISQRLEQGFAAVNQQLAALDERLAKTVSEQVASATSAITEQAVAVAKQTAVTAAREAAAAAVQDAAEATSDRAAAIASERVTAAAVEAAERAAKHQVEVLSEHLRNSQAPDGQGLVESDRRFAEAGQRLAETDQRLAAVDQHFAETDQRLAEAGQRLAATDQRLAATDQRLAATDQRFNETALRFTETDQRFAAADQRLEALALTTGSLTERLAAAEAGLAAPAELAAELRQSAPSVESVVSAVLERLPHLAHLAAAVDQRIASAEQRVAALGQQTSDLDQRVAGFDQRLVAGTTTTAALLSDTDQRMGMAVSELKSEMLATVAAELASRPAADPAAIAATVQAAVEAALDARIAAQVETALSGRLPSEIDQAVQNAVQAAVASTPTDPEALRREVEIGLTGRIDKVVASKVAEAAAGAASRGADPVAAGRAAAEERSRAARFEADMEWRIEKLAAERGWCSLGDVQAVVDQAMKNGTGSGAHGAPQFARLEAALSEFVRQTIHQQEQFINALQQRFERGTALLLRKAAAPSGHTVREPSDSRRRMSATAPAAELPVAGDDSSSLLPAVDAAAMDAVDREAVAAAESALAQAASADLPSLTGSIASGFTSLLRQPAVDGDGAPPEAEPVSTAGHAAEAPTSVTVSAQAAARPVTDRIAAPEAEPSDVPRGTGALALTTTEAVTRAVNDEAPTKPLGVHQTMPVAPPAPETAEVRLRELVEAAVRAEVDRQRETWTKAPEALPATAVADPDQVQALVRQEFDRRLGEMSASRAAAKVQAGLSGARDVSTLRGGGDEELRRGLVRVLPAVLGDPAVAQRLFALLAMEAVANPGALADLTGLRAFLRAELAMAREPVAN